MSNPEKTTSYIAKVLDEGSLCSLIDLNSIIKFLILGGKFPRLHDETFCMHFLQVVMIFRQEMTVNSLRSLHKNDEAKLAEFNQQVNDGALNNYRDVLTVNNAMRKLNHNLVVIKIILLLKTLP